MTLNTASLRRQLEAERSELLETISHYEVVVRQKRPGLGNHMADDGTDAFEQAASLALHRNEQALLDQVDRALARMDKGTYGTCERCGGKIDYARLKAIPYASLCIDCQTLLETPKSNSARR